MEKKRKAEPLPLDDSNAPHLSRAKVDSQDVAFLDVQVIKFVEDFRCLDNVLYGLRKKKEPGIWSRVCEAVESMTGNSFSLSDLALILTTFRQAFVVEWKQVRVNSTTDLELHLCISICDIPIELESNNDSNSSSSGTSSSSSSGSSSSSDYNNNNNNNDRNTNNVNVGSTANSLPKVMSQQSRLRMFRQLLDDQIIAITSEKSHLKEGNHHPHTNLVLQANIDDVIPPRPASILPANHQHNEAIAVSKIANKLIEESAKIAEAELMQIPAVTANGKPLSGLERLRLLAAEREKVQEAKVASANEEFRVLQEYHRIKGLATLCDALRSKSVKSRSHRNAYPYHDLISEFSASMRVSVSEMKARIELACQVVPEFVSILPPDQYVKVSVVRINTDAPYAVIRAKVEAFVKQSLLNHTHKHPRSSV